MLDNKYFGIILTFATFEIGKMLNKKLKSPIANPLLISIALCILFLKVTGISYESYKQGGDFIMFFIAPATVAMVVDLYENLDELKKNLFPILIGTLLGSILAMLFIVISYKLAGFEKSIIISSAPQSITTAIAIALSEEYGGNPAITAVLVVLRGVTGAVIAPIIIKAFRIKDPTAQGVAIGTSSHAVGTSEARKIGEIQGAMSGLSIAVTGLVTVILMPIIMKLI
ncbi:putative murein hydrolase (TIGR00659 family) [Peptoniphilus koenoeneniae]|uniref:Murein hydrolase (TIGR00659 family) n=1 Tax=Peptoniphilus koenoeneniae TaxID=507751 RepID=A0ABU0ATJ0_9FIRM|nr:MULTISPECIES: LrgB family protein [Peptoniphilus]ERT61635.1 TIGR00659 family protein [Peptoniphilus sp. BV3C26]MDQ0274320.1 putative murein hydrolase (TIGR00659 family) [Peptoniphilus koenoeneniae]